MEIRKKFEVEKTFGYVCDVCKQSCNKSLDPRYEDHEHAKLSAFWGFHSKRDCTYTECDLCEDCFEKVAEFIKSLGGTVREIEHGACDREVNYLKKEGQDYDLI